MALTLVDKVLSGNFKKPLPPPLTADGGGKRKRTESGSSSGSNRSANSFRHSGGDLLPGFTLGDSHGGGRGSFPIHFGKRGGNSGGSRYSRFDKQDSRHTGGGRSSGSGTGRGGGYDGRYSSAPKAVAATKTATSLAFF
jgi:hypothetical protein